MTASPADPVIRIEGLTKRYGHTLALDHLDLEVPAGCIFGFLGPNGAGKSTTIRLLMGAIRPTAGSATILGRDTLAGRREVHRQVGYLPGDFTAYRDLTAGQYLTYLGHLRGGIDVAVLEGLAERFDLDLSRRISAASHGNRQKVGIIAACMHQPELLVLDEPTQGLDPLMQRTFLDVLREHRDAGGTVFLSSHILAEVEEVADTVAIIREGRLATVTDIGTLKERTRRRVELRFADPDNPPVAELGAVANVSGVEPADGAITLLVEGSMAEMFQVAAPFGIEQIVAEEVDLQDLFFQYYGGR